MRCKNCGAIINDDQVYCSVCRRAGYISHSMDNSFNEGGAVDDGFDINLCVLSFSALFVIALLFCPAVCGGLKGTDFGNSYFTFFTLSVISAIAVADIIILSLLMRNFSILGLMMTVIGTPFAIMQYNSPVEHRHHDIQTLFMFIFFAAGYWVVQTIINRKEKYEAEGMYGKANSLIYGLFAGGATGLFLIVAVAAYSTIRML